MINLDSLLKAKCFSEGCSITAFNDCKGCAQARGLPGFQQTLVVNHFCDDDEESVPIEWFFHSDGTACSAVDPDDGLIASFEGSPSWELLQQRKRAEDKKPVVIYLSDTSDEELGKEFQQEVKQRKQRKSLAPKKQLKKLTKKRSTKPTFCCYEHATRGGRCSPLSMLCCCNDSSCKYRHAK
jgi:hypothetical protein